jgi:hypothetical protein
MKRSGNPIIYLTMGVVLIFYVAMANHNGWSLVQAFSSRTWQHLNPNTQHK